MQMIENWSRVINGPFLKNWSDLPDRPNYWLQARNTFFFITATRIISFDNILWSYLQLSDVLWCVIHDPEDCNIVVQYKVCQNMQ